MQAQHFPFDRRTGSTVFFLLMLGAGAGFINGLLGAGGGILLVYVLRGYVNRRYPKNSDTLAKAHRDIYANALAVMLPVSVFSALHYVLSGTLKTASFSFVILPSVAGGILGGWLLDKLKLSWLRRLFALLVLCSGVLMVLRA